MKHPVIAGNFSFQFQRATNKFKHAETFKLCCCPPCKALPLGMRDENEYTPVPKKLFGVRHKNLSDWLCNLNNLQYYTQNSSKGRAEVSKNFCGSVQQNKLVTIVQVAHVYFWHLHGALATHTNTYIYTRCYKFLNWQQKIDDASRASARNRTQMMNDKRNNRHTHDHN